MNRTKSHRPEILAPAGDRACLEAAVSQGADAVYFGLEAFNARHRAINFSSDDLPEIMRWLHRHRVRGYIALNTLIFSDELPRAEELITRIAHARVDAVIVQDWGLARLCREVAPAVEIHGSTQMTLTEPRGLEWAKSLGITRAVLPRELSVSEIGRVVAATDMPLEVFVHGALCVSYSGQCLTSEALGGRSANRGQCAQACRQPYEILVDGIVRERTEGAYVLSPLDMASPDVIAELARLGVASLKIEGRLKGPEYVATTVRTYRKAVDAACRGIQYNPGESDWNDLSLAYSRGFSHGFLLGINHQRLVPGRHPKARGIHLGEVIGRDRRALLVRLNPSTLPITTRLAAGDGVVVDEGKPEEREAGGRVRAVRPAPSHSPGEALFWVEMGPDDLPPRPFIPGARLHKTDAPEFRQRVRQWIHAGVKVPQYTWKIDWHIHGKEGYPLRLEAACEPLGGASSEWPGPLEKARRSPDSDFLTRPLGALGGTSFSLGNIESTLEEGLMVPASVLNRLRREVLDQMEALRIAWTDSPGPNLVGGLDRLRMHDSRERKNHAILHNEPGLVILTRTLAQVTAIANWHSLPLTTRPRLIWLDFEDPRLWEEGIRICRDAGLSVGIAPLRIVKPGEDPLVTRALRLDIDAVLARNLATLDLFLKEAPRVLRVADLTLNLVNDLSVSWLQSANLTRWTPGQDLNWSQFENLLRRVDPSGIEFVAHLCMPMFHTEHCVYAANLSKGSTHLDCGRPCEKHRIILRDPAGMPFPVLVDAGCRNTVYNSRAQSASEHLARLVTLGVRHFRIELLEQSPEQTITLVEGYTRVIRGEETGFSLWKRLRLDHQFGLTRGTLNLA